ncbi:MAG: molybdenum ABC transporter ATP-binding protein [Pseudomonadota bacterium]
MTVSVTLTHRFAGFALDVDFAAPPGVTALFGRSGSGKTSVVNAVAGLLRPDQGRIVVGAEVLLDTARGLRVPVHKRRIGMVFQDGRLFPHLTVRQNLTYGQWFAPKGADEFDHVVALLGLKALLHRRPGTLSGGEAQRVAIGRALLSRPRLLLMDEPLSALDDARKAEVLPYLERLRDETNIPILLVSHSVAEVARLATTVVALEAGRVVACGPAASILADPETVPVFGVRDAGAVLEGVIAAQHGDGLTEIAVSAGRLFVPRVSGEAGARLRLRIAAQDVILSRTAPVGLSALNILAGTVTAVRRGGHGGAMVQIAAGSDTILARITARSADALALEPGVAVHAIAKSVGVAQADVGRVGPDPVS